MRAALPASSPGRSTSLGSGSTPRTRTAQETDGDRACAGRESERRGDPEREGPTGEGGGGEKGLAAGGSAPPALPLWTRHCLLKGHSGIRILTAQEEGEPRGRGRGAAA